MDAFRMIEPPSGSSGSVLYREKHALHIAIKERVVILLRDLAHGGELRATGIREHNIELAFLALDLCEEALQIVNFETSPGTPVTFLPISAAAANSDSRRPVMKTYAPSLAKSFADARPIPLLPPVTSATFPSSVPIHFSSVFWITVMIQIQNVTSVETLISRQRSASAA
jgi:hypothetical protein